MDPCDDMKKLGVILEVRNLSKSFNGITAVNDVSFDLSYNETLALLGPNGAGKSTLVNILTGIFPLDRGYVRFEGVDVAGLQMNQLAQKGIVRTFQRTRLFNELSVLDNLLIGAVARDQISRKTALAEAEKWLERLRLQDLRNVQASTLPYGYKRFVEIGRAMMTRPRLLILDEPGAGMSTEEQDLVVKVLREVRDAGTVLLFVEHISDIIFSLATKVLVLHHGQKIYEGDPSQMAAQPQVQQVYFGRLGGNVIVS
jgi:branched-chain amino acid transport system ATP-binding protein